MSSLYEQLRIRFYIHQNFPGDDFEVSKIKVKQACLNKLQYLIVRRLGAFAVLKYHHSNSDAFAPHPVHNKILNPRDSLRICPMPLLARRAASATQRTLVKFRMDMYIRPPM